ncbi:MAG: capsular biosynthesis protein [Burkholderiales bacterium]|nr:capsular biosynthesis protein [Burkholderiales bacterium]
MIDLHTHFLHGIDDGAQTLSESLALAKAAVADGITAAAMTPHIHPGRFDNVKSHILAHVAAFQTALHDQGIPLKVFAGAEVRLGVESFEQILAGDVPYLGRVNGCDVLLLELPHQHIPVGSQQLVNKLLSMNIRPIIAHPERNKSVMDDPRRIHPFVDAGCWLQVTAGSITGDFGSAAKKAALNLLADDWVHIVASDAHNLGARPPKLSQARLAVAQAYGEDVAQLLFHTRPARILGIG